MIQQTSMLIILMMMVILLPNLFESKCWQKNTKREANRDQYICRNQLFEPGQKIADPENCDCYYDCNYRQQPCYSCCPNGQIFSAKQNDCVLRSAFQCQNQPLRYRCEGRGLFRNLEHCRKYWDCRNSNVDDEPVEEACPDDYHWDDSKKICRKDSEIPLILRTCNDN
ncbi:chitin binding [Dermatophagoides pteronyssinus]|uniref:Chitin binding n=1 Tax=Dermatophagoides pteronyssinus TaxID=6956 RepID=A0ABQ8IVI4_DERPT|nr:chitin binding [Dermatophagoides pteronyssinus]